MQMKHRSSGPTRTTAGGRIWSTILVVMFLLFGGTAYGQQAASVDPQRAVVAPPDPAEIGAKLSNPVSDVWALFTEFDLSFSDGDVNKGDSKVGGRMIFQPILPFPLYGKGKDEWKLIVRPTIPVLFSQPVPTGFDKFTHLGGLGDLQLPMLVSPPAENWILGAGVDWLFPTATRHQFGRDQWGAGPTGVLGYKNKDMTLALFPQYYFGFAGAGQSKHTPDASYLNMLYAAVLNLPDAWQIGMNPTITYDAKASSGNKWNVPIGIFAAKTTVIGNIPVKFQLGVEYSVVHQDAFGQRAQIKLNIIPVVPALIQNAIFGGS